MAYEFIPYRPEFRDQVMELRREAYEDDFPEAAAYLEWKYERNPYIREPLYYLACYGGKVVGMRGAYGTCWLAGDSDEPIVLPCADDFAIARGHRDAGLATQIMRVALDDLARRGFDYAINTSGGQVTVLSSLVQGWKSIGAMEPVARVGLLRRLRRAFRGRVRRKPVVWRIAGSPDTTGPVDPHPYERLDLVGARPGRHPGTRIAVESHPRADTMAAIAARCADRSRIRHVRDATFTEWRYRNPIHVYRFLFYERDGNTEGYLVVTRHMAYAAPKLPFHIAELVGTTPEVRAELLQSALDWGRFPEWARGRGRRRTRTGRCSRARGSSKPAMCFAAAVFPAC